MDATELCVGEAAEGVESEVDKSEFCITGTAGGTGVALDIEESGAKDKIWLTETNVDGEGINVVDGNGSTNVLLGIWLSADG